MLQVVQDRERSGGGLVSIVVDDLGSAERGLVQHGLDATVTHDGGWSMFVRIEDPFAELAHVRTVVSSSRAGCPARS